MGVGGWGLGFGVWSLGFHCHLAQLCSVAPAAEVGAVPARTRRDYNRKRLWYLGVAWAAAHAEQVIVGLQQLHEDGDDEGVSQSAHECQCDVGVGFGGGWGQV